MLLCSLCIRCADRFFVCGWPWFGATAAEAKAYLPVRSSPLTRLHANGACAFMLAC